MKHLYPANGLPFFTEAEIDLREHFVRSLALEVRGALLTENKAWQFHRIEGPLLTPVALINSNYTEQDVWFQAGEVPLVLRPETTPASYFYAYHLLEQQQAMPPLCVWQVGKSFRREDDQPTKHCRFKEFYQQEFQCLYNVTTKNDYQAKIAPAIEEWVRQTLKMPTRLVDSDRLPSYSLKTLDVEVYNGDKWMEVCSISVRTDFKGPTDKIEYRVLEVAMGVDRLIYNYNPPASQPNTAP
jgi:glycyl-tRNA synthetase